MIRVPANHDTATYSQKKVAIRRIFLILSLNRCKRKKKIPKKKRKIFTKRRTEFFSSFLHLLSFHCRDDVIENGVWEQKSLPLPSTPKILSSEERPHNAILSNAVHLSTLCPGDMQRPPHGVKVSPRPEARDPQEVDCLLGVDFRADMERDDDCLLSLCWLSS